MNPRKNGMVLNAGALLAAFAASLCCILPLAVAVLGVGSAALATQLEPLRPWLAGMTTILLGIAFYRAYRPVACEPGDDCAIPVDRGRQRVVLWIVALVALILMAFPYYSSWVF